MLHLVTGGSASGKSAYGEQAVQKAGTPFCYYLATMHPWGEEGQARAARHRRQRAGKGFITIEAYRCLEQVVLQPRQALQRDKAVLVECMSNLVANELFEGGGSDREILRRIEHGICHLLDSAETVVVVTNEVFSDGVAYEAGTMRYIRLLGQANQRLAVLADKVTEVVYGIATERKAGAFGLAKEGM